MNRRTPIALAVAALAAILAAAFLGRSSQPQREDPAAAPSGWLVPALRERVNDVTRLTLTGAGDKALVTLERADGAWKLSERGGYPIDTSKLRSFLLKLADAREVEAKTANPEKYAILGVEDVAKPDAKGVQVELAGLGEPVRLIVGNTAPKGEGTYVRRADDAQSWLVTAALSPEREPAGWLAKDLADLAADRFESVEVTPTQGKPFRIAKAHEGDANFQLADIPKGRTAAAEFTVNEPANALSHLNFDDVAPAAQAEPPENAIHARFAAFDGLVVAATAWEHEGKHYLRLEASSDEAHAARHIEAAQAKAKADYEAELAKAEAAPKAPTEDGGDKPAAEATPAADAPVKPLAVSDPGKDRDERLAHLDKEVRELQARFTGWTFTVPTWKYANFDKKLDDLLLPLEDKPAPAGKGK